MPSGLPGSWATRATSAVSTWGPVVVCRAWSWRHVGPRRRGSSWIGVRGVRLLWCGRSNFWGWALGLRSDTATLHNLPGIRTWQNRSTSWWRAPSAPRRSPSSAPRDSCQSGAGSSSANQREPIRRAGRWRRWPGWGWPFGVPAWRRGSWKSSSRHRTRRGSRGGLRQCNASPCTEAGQPPSTARMECFT